ncbi:MAG TPA: lmo0937 family membrane protein [Polyangiaceae bacterium]|nr:lmo0937 family membrane protein [Polyangiaceae bacterium]
MQRASAAPSEVYIMLYTLVVVLLVLWALGLATSYTLGGVLHLLLVAALVLLAVQLITGRRTV